MVLKINYLLIKEKIKNMITCQFIWYVRKSLVKMKERKRKHFSICVREFIWFFKIKIPFLVLLFNFILVKKKNSTNPKFSIQCPSLLLLLFLNICFYPSTLGLILIWSLIFKMLHILVSFEFGFNLAFIS